MPYFTLKILRSSPRRHRGERTTTIPMKTPPLPVEFAVDGCFILCSSWESVPCKMGEICYTKNSKQAEGDISMTDQELLQAIRTITREELQESEKRMKGEIQESEKRMKGEIQESEKRMKGEIQESEKCMRGEIQESEKRMRGEIQESEKRMRGEIQESEKRMRGEIQESQKQISKDVAILMDAEFSPKFNLLAEELSIIREKVENLEKKVDGLEDKVLEHDFRLKIIK